MRELHIIALFFAVMIGLGTAHTVSKAMNNDIERQLSSCGRC